MPARDTKTSGRPSSVGEVDESLLHQRSLKTQCLICKHLYSRRRRRMAAFPVASWWRSDGRHDHAPRPGRSPHPYERLRQIR